MSGDRTKAFLEGSQAQQIAILTLHGDTDVSIAEQLNLSPSKVKAIKRKDEFWECMEAEAKHIAETLRLKFRKRLEGADHHAWETFLYHLKEKKTLEAVRMYAEWIGLKPKDDQGADVPAVSIIMPGAQPQPKDVTPEFEVKNAYSQGIEPQVVGSNPGGGGEPGDTPLQDQSSEAGVGEADGGDERA